MKMMQLSFPGRDEVANPESRCTHIAVYGSLDSGFARLPARPRND